MEKYKVYNDKLPLYSNKKTIREKRKQQYLKEIKEYYSNLEEIREEDYYRLKTTIENESAKKELMEKSIPSIINVLAGIYAKYKIDDIVPFEDGLSYVLKRYNKSIKNFQSLPELKCEYEVSVINFYIYKFINHYYNISKFEKSLYSFMEPSSITYSIDKIESDKFDCLDIIKEDVRDSINNMISKLKPREARILKLRYGLFDGDEKTFDEIARSENITRSRVEQVLKETLEDIKQSSKSTYIKAYNDYNVNSLD